MPPMAVDKGCYGTEDGDHEEYTNDEGDEDTDDEDTNRDDEYKDYADDEDSDDWWTVDEEVKVNERIVRIVNSGDAVEALKANLDHCVVIRGHEVRATVGEEPGCTPRLWRWDDDDDTSITMTGRMRAHPSPFTGFTSSR
ncbi:hypothetical protein MUK42_15854 [Musa troglodytarum]|uniref:Uncharacterized protein n=1 Tax=Musa troglodytarum TaxID=320322 RepID=A0A9E7KYU8_9LILI|nr:hypothetical protein MUK42_15854 [Musa troglodytarum]